MLLAQAKEDEGKEKILGSNYDNMTVLNFSLCVFNYLYCSSFWTKILNQ